MLRRAMLFFGAGVVASKAAAQAGNDTSIAQEVLDNAKPMADYTALRAYTGRAAGARITGAGLAGMFQREDADATSVDNGVTVVVDAAGRRWKRRFDGPVDVRWAGGVVDDGVSDASAATQKLANLCDSGLARHIKISNWNGTFFWPSTVTVINPGVRIFGDQSATYNRGPGKQGWLTGKAGLTRFFDLGASRSSGNPADQWQLDGLSFRQASAVPARTIDGISFTSRTNGPDRGAIIRDTSFIGLRDAVTTENPDVATVLASMNIEGCVFQGCRSALNAKGHIFGLRFVGNQCEQNFGNGVTGVIGGSINGPVTITDNMLEGQPNVISFDVPPVTGSKPSAQIARNYFERNGGDYVIRFRCSASGASLEVGPNFLQTVEAKDYLLVEGSAGSVTLENRDPFPLTIKDSSLRIQYGSRPFNSRVRGYEVRRLSTASHTPEIVLADFANLVDDAGTWVHALPGSGSTAMTPFGTRNITASGADLDFRMSVAAGDLMCLNVLMRVREATAGAFAIHVRNESLAHVRGGGAASSLPSDLRGRWALLSLPFIAQAAASGLRVRLLTVSGSYPNAIAGITARNFGAFKNDGTTKVLIEPVVPNVT